MKTILSIVLAFLTFPVLLAQETGGPYSSDENTVLLCTSMAMPQTQPLLGITGLLMAPEFHTKPAFTGSACGSTILLPTNKAG